VKRLLLTGDSGFIGSQAVKPLVRRGFEIDAVNTHELTAAERGEHRLGPAAGAERGRHAAVRGGRLDALADARSGRRAGGELAVKSNRCIGRAWGGPLAGWWERLPGGGVGSRSGGAG
jgi:nucleoside-diphosphate-sugar epimerase